MALRDKSLEDVSIILENGLIEDRYWLPRRQQIEIRRSGTWLDFPFRGIIRGRWEIRQYDVNTGLPGIAFGGPEIELAPPDRRAAFTFTGELLDGLPPDVRTVQDADVRAVQDAAREMVRAQALQRTRATALQARSLSDFVRVNRVEGLSLGAGLTQRLGGGVRLGGTARISTENADVRGTAALAYERASGAGLSLRIERQLGEIGAVPEVSVTRNSIAAQEFGSDWTSPFERRQVALRIDLPPLRERHWRSALEFAVERQVTSVQRATPARGRYEGVPVIDAGDFQRASLLLRRPTSLGWLGTEVALNASLDAIRSEADTWTFGRGILDLDVQRPVGHDRLVLRTIAAGVTGPHVPVQYETWMGGPVTAPGMGFHSLRGHAGVSQRIEWQHGVPGPSIPLGRYGKVPAQVVLAPFVTLAWTDGRSAVQFTPRAGWYPSVGIGGIGLFNLLRADVARGLRDGRWMFSLDVSRDFWRIL